MKYSGALIGQEGVVCGKDLRPRWRYYVKKGVPRGGVCRKYSGRIAREDELLVACILFLLDFFRA